MSDLVYKAPPPPPSIRRVYVLPKELLLRVHQYGFEGGHPSEVSAVRELLEDALLRYETDAPAEKEPGR